MHHFGTIKQGCISYRPGAVFPRAVTLRLIRITLRMGLKYLSFLLHVRLIDSSDYGLSVILARIAC